MAIQKKKQSQNTLAEYIGWIGVVLVLGSYALLALDIIDSDSGLYHALVLAGSLFVATISYKKRTYQPAILNTAFALFAVIALARIIIINY